MIAPQYAVVRPRVFAPQSGESLLLEDEVRQWVESGARGHIAVVGLPGAGKTVALRHLAAVLGPAARVALLDEPDCDAFLKTSSADLVVYTAEHATAGPRLATYHLAPWGPDDWIEYLLARHRPRCAAVMARVRPIDAVLLGGQPERWAALLDLLADDDSLPDARHALHRYLGNFLSDTDLLERARSVCLNALVATGEDLPSALEKLARPGFGPALVRALSCPTARVLLAAERVADDLHGDGACDCLAHRLPRDLVKTTATLCAGDLEALAHLHQLLEGPPWSHAMTASVLHALDVGWAPLPDDVPCLAGAYLNEAKWPGVQLAGIDLTETDFNGADLHEADLSGARIERADFTGANLQGAVLTGAQAAGTVLRQACLRKARLDGLGAAGAHFSGADLMEAVAEGANFNDALLDRADLSGAHLYDAVFLGADLTAAVLAGADLNGANLHEAKLAGADFSGAELAHAKLTGLRLRDATWIGAGFHAAWMDKCDLEYLNLPGADFSDAHLCGALLTGALMADADLAGAVLRDAGLADVSWERVDLRNADLSGASFHMGSSRSGLVHSPIASEGSRTGFYTDEYDEQTYKAPEEIRKANLCGADLRGAKLDGVDFYLVDLRGAQYDAAHETYLRSCGAILEARV